MADTAGAGWSRSTAAPRRGFRYALHTDLGHRWVRAAKLNAYGSAHSALENGQRVEIITVKEGERAATAESGLGYWVTHRARSKWRTWFRQRDVGDRSPRSARCWTRN